jgi:hypothetical protein
MVVSRRQTIAFCPLGGSTSCTSTIVSERGHETAAEQ